MQLLGIFLLFILTQGLFIFPVHAAEDFGAPFENKTPQALKLERTSDDESRLQEIEPAAGSDEPAEAIKKQSFPKDLTPGMGSQAPFVKSEKPAE